MPTPLRNAWRRPRNLPLAKLAAGYVGDVSDVPFRTSLTPSVGSAPTLTRALTATVVDHEGILRTAKSGEVRFSGLRRVENLVPSSQDMATGSWARVGSTVVKNAALAPDGSMTANLLTGSVNGSVSVYTANIAVMPNSQYRLFAHFKAGTSALHLLSVSDNVNSGCNLYFNAATNALVISSPFGGWGYSSSTVTVLSDGWVQISALITSNSDDLFTTVYACGCETAASGQVVGKTCLVWGVQLENVTNQAVQTASEYVSNGVLSAPFHGAGVDGVKYFNTTLAGVSLNPLTTNWIRNNTAQGAVIGTPGTDPTNWSINGSAGIAKSIVGKGVDSDGITYIDVRWFGTASASGSIAAIFEPTTSIAAVLGETWTNSFYCKLIAGSTAGTAWANAIEEANSGGSYLSSQTTPINLTAPTLIESRAHGMRTLSSATVAFVRSYLYSAISNGAVVDCTLRIGLPQLQKLPYVTPAIPTTGAAASAAIAGFPRCLVESSRTNLLTYSEQFDSAAWSKTAATVTANAIVAPDGTTTMDKLIENASLGEHMIDEAPTVVSGTTYTFSVFAKAGELTKLVLRNALNFPDKLTVFNLSSGTVFSSTNGAGNYGIELFRDGIYRLWVNIVASGNGAGMCRLQLCNASGVNVYAGTAGYGIYIWGAQLESGNRPSSYIPTLASAVTRPVDVLAHNLTLGNTGTWVVTLSPAEVPSQAGTYPLLAIQGVQAVNQIGLFTQPAGSTLGLTVFTNGVQVVSGTIQSNIVAGGVYRVALSWSASARRITYCINGGTPGSVTAVDMPQALSSFSTAAGNPWIGTVSDSEIFTVEHPPETLKLMSAL